MSNIPNSVSIIPMKFLLFFFLHHVHPVLVSSFEFSFSVDSRMVLIFKMHICTLFLSHTLCVRVSRSVYVVSINLLIPFGCLTRSTLLFTTVQSIRRIISVRKAKNTKKIIEKNVNANVYSP